MTPEESADLRLDRLPKDFLQDPYPYYAYLRERVPVHYSEVWGGWCLARWSDVVVALKDPRLSARRMDAFVNLVSPEHRSEFLLLAKLQASGMGMNDAPEHMRLRRLVSSALSYKAVEDLRGEIRTTVDHLIARMRADDGPIDLISAFAFPLPATVIARVIGIPTNDVHRIKEWSDEANSLLAHGKPTRESIARTTIGAFRLVEFYRTLIAERRDSPQDDLVSSMIAMCDTDPSYSEDDLIAVLVPLAVAGHETTTNLIGNGMLALLRSPSQLELLRADPSLLGSAIEELLRYDSPVHRTTRVASENVVIGGRSIARGDLVISLLGSANRDPSQFEDADQLDITRTARNVAFGYGAHTCVGAALARLEGQVAFAALLEAFPRLELVDGGFEWADDIAFRGLQRLLIRLRP